MKLSLASVILPIFLAACTTTKYVEVPVEVPVYPVVLADKPKPPALDGLTWSYLPQEEYFALGAEEFDKYRNNMQELDTYIKLLQEGWNYYETVSKPDPEG